jgi:hypothetical protein
MTRIALGILDWFVALTAGAGGMALATGMEATRFPPDMLKGSPFGDHVVPGLILAIVVGGSAAVGALAIWFRPAAGASATVLAGLVLMGWIAGEVLMLSGTARSWLEPFYFAVGVSVVALGLIAVRRVRTRG